MTGTLLGSLFSHTCIPLKSPPTNHWNGSLSAGTPKTVGLLIQHLKHYITLPTLPTFDCSGGLLSFEILRWPQFPPPTGSVAPQTRPHRRHRHGDPGGSRRLRPALGRWAALPAAWKRWKDRGSARCGGGRWFFPKILWKLLIAMFDYWRGYQNVSSFAEIVVCR